MKKHRFIKLDFVLNLIIITLAVIVLLSSCGTKGGQTTVAPDTQPEPIYNQEPVQETDMGTDENTGDGEVELVENTLFPKHKIDYPGLTINSYEDIDKIYKFTLNGHEYQLPCTIQEFLDNGVYIPEKDLNYIIPANRVINAIKIYPDGKIELSEEELDAIDSEALTNENSDTEEEAQVEEITVPFIEISVVNETENSLSLRKCNKVIGVVVRPNSNVTFLIGSGIDVLDGDTNIETLREYFGTDPEIYSEDTEGYSWKFYKKINPNLSNNSLLKSTLGTDYVKVDGAFRMNYSGRPE